MEVNRLLKSRFFIKLTATMRWTENKGKKKHQRRVEAWERSFLTVIAVTGGADDAAAAFLPLKIVFRSSSSEK